MEEDEAGDESQRTRGVWELHGGAMRKERFKGGEGQGEHKQIAGFFDVSVWERHVILKLTWLL